MNTNKTIPSVNQDRKPVRQVHFLDIEYMKLLLSKNKDLYDRIKKALTDPSVSPAERFYYKIMLRRGIWEYGC